MIRVQDWIGSIPDEEKHIAYVGEGMSETREFWLCGDGWEAYKEWSFHLDMAFDPESIITRDSRQVVQTRRNSTEMKETAAVILDETVTKETYTVQDEKMPDYDLTDIASLTKTVEEDGIRLRWLVLRQHTVLPGKLWATLRAVDSTGNKVKKSAIMVFEVDAAICAIPAARPAISEMEQIEARVAAAADTATYCAERAESALRNIQNDKYLCQDAAEQAGGWAQAAETSADKAQGYASTAESSVKAVQEYANAVAVNAANVSKQVTAATTAQQNATTAQQNATAAAERSVLYAQLSEQYAEETLQAVESLTYHRVNVRDCGAVGDGVTDDRNAIIAAFELAKAMLPCEVYFPAGVYGISNGITVEMPYGSGGLAVRGAGSDITTITYLDSYDPDQKSNMWYAIRIWPQGRPDSIPHEEDYLHDISYTGLTVHDPNPCAHAWHTAKGDPANEETHGIDIHCCKGVSVTDCQFITVGDEAIDICFCHDVVVMNNRLVGSPGAGPGGGAISIGDGCKGVVVSGNTVNGCAPDETLDNGTVIKKSNYGIALESLEYPLQDVTVTGNTILNMHGKGINLGATGGSASITNVVIADNVIRDCELGIRLAGTLPKDNIKITNNLICNCLDEGIWTCTVGNITICGNTFRNIKGTYAIHTTTMNGSSRQFIADNVFENVEYGGVYCAGKVILKDCVFNGLGTAATAPSSNTYGVYKTSGTLTVDGCIFRDVRMATLKTCLQEVDYLYNTDVEVVNKSTGVVDGGGASLGGVITKRIIGCSLMGQVTIKQDNAIVQASKIVYVGSTHAVTVTANRVSITGCIIENNSASGSYKAINESSGYNYNLFANNIVNRTITTTGAQSMAVNNIDTRVTA